MIDFGHSEEREEPRDVKVKGLVVERVKIQLDFSTEDFDVVVVKSSQRPQHFAVHPVPFTQHVLPLGNRARARAFLFAASDANERQPHTTQAAGVSRTRLQQAWHSPLPPQREQVASGWNGPISTVPFPSQ